ncbi:unnamed protein product [Thelazia callipaeda]|uniref:Cadherin domain-containing protein n=1 Tax=Thelazia callipaeda TaxID=103827 RepID=A0A0N5D5W7_THECL|nr:unnamed protein product [Thelazia callipaeda]
MKLKSELSSAIDKHCIQSIHRPLDYEDPTQRQGFTLGIRVYDGRYYATTKLFIKLLDCNDNPPVINGPQFAELPENSRRGKQIARFTVQDADANDTALLILIALLCTWVVVEAQELSHLLLGSYPGQSRFLNFAGKSQRDIVVRLTKNLTEDTPVGTLIATFRAEDKDSMTHNLT